MRRNTLLSLRLPSVTYVYVCSRRDNPRSPCLARISCQKTPSTGVGFNSARAPRLTCNFYPKIGRPQLGIIFRALRNLLASDDKNPSTDAEQKFGALIFQYVISTEAHIGRVVEKSISNTHSFNHTTGVIALKEGFFEQVYKIVSDIPRGKVLSYGDVARLCGNPKMSRQVGWALHCNPRPGVVPCHRVVFKDGSLSRGFAFGGPEVQAALLKEEGVEVENCKVDMKKYRWNI